MAKGKRTEQIAKVDAERHKLLRKLIKKKMKAMSYEELSSLAVQAGVPMTASSPVPDLRVSDEHTAFARAGAAEIGG